MARPVGRLGAGRSNLDRNPQRIIRRLGCRPSANSADGCLRWGDRLLRRESTKDPYQEYCGRSRSSIGGWRKFETLRRRYAPTSIFSYLLDQGDVTLHELMSIIALAILFLRGQTFPESRAAINDRTWTHGREKFI